MNPTKRTTLAVQGVTIAVQHRGDQDFISLTDIARYRNSQEPFAIINNSVLIRQGLPQPERLAMLNGIAITQMRTLLPASNAKRLK